MKYFTQKELDDFSNGTLNCPMFFYTGKQTENVVHVFSLDAMSGMRENKGIPTTLHFRDLRKDGPSKKLVYKLVEEEEIKV